MQIPRLIMMQNMQQSLKAYEQRVADSHKLSMKLLGLENPAEVEDEMGAISVAGDTHIYQVPLQQPVQQPQPAPVQPAPVPVQQSNGLTKYVAPLLTAAAGAAGTYFLLDHFNQSDSSPPVLMQPEDWQLGVEVKDRG